MAEVISNTSPLLYLHRIGKLDWLQQLFSSVWVPRAVIEELREGRLKVLLEAKSRGLTSSIAPLLTGLETSGMWISESLRRRVLALAGE